MMFACFFHDVSMLKIEEGMQKVYGSFGVVRCIAAGALHMHIFAGTPFPYTYGSC